jgi:hypothetical protein
MTLLYNGPMNIFRNASGNIPAPNMTLYIKRDIQGVATPRYTASPNSITINSANDAGPTLIVVGNSPSMVIGGGETTIGIPPVYIGQTGDYLTLSVTSKITSVQNMPAPTPKTKPVSIINGTVTFNVHDQLSPNNSIPVVNQPVTIFAYDPTSDPSVLERNTAITGVTDNNGNLQVSAGFNMGLVYTGNQADIDIASPKGHVLFPKNSLLIASDVPAWNNRTTVEPLVSWQTWERYAVGYSTWITDREKAYSQYHNLWNAALFDNGDLSSIGFDKNGIPKAWVLWPKDQYLIGAYDSPGALLPGGISNGVSAAVMTVQSLSTAPSNRPASPAGATAAAVGAGVAAAAVVTRKKWLPLIPPLRAVSVAISLATTKSGAASLYFDQKKGPKQVTVDVMDSTGKVVIPGIQVFKGENAEVDLPSLGKTVLTAKVRKYRNVSKQKSTEYDPFI